MQEFVDDQVLSPALVAGVLRTTPTEIASTLDIGRDASYRILHLVLLALVAGRTDAVRG